MRFVEETGGAWTAEQLRAAEAEIEQQKREWEANRLATLQKEEELRKIENQNEDFITYSREDAKNQVNKKVVNEKKINNKPIPNVTKKQLTQLGRKTIQGTVKRKSFPAKELQNKKRKVLLRNLKPKLTLPNSNEIKQKTRTKRKTTSSSQKYFIPTKGRNSLRFGKPRRRIPPIEVHQGNGNNITSSDESSQNSEDYSECSLDVMVDSNEANGTPNCINRQKNITSSDESEMSSRHSSHTSLNKLEFVENHVDVNSPRTRSRGSVKINLWTLDISPILPGVRPVNTRNSRRTEGNNATNSDFNKSREGSTSSNNSHQSKKEFKSKERGKCNETKALKISRTSLSRETNNFLINSELNITPKIGKKIKSTSKQIDKNHKLDKWLLKSPMVVLTKTNNTSTPRRSLMESLKGCRMTRRTSLLKSNPGFGPS